MSEKLATVVRFKLDFHPNAETLSIANIEGSEWKVVVKTSEFKKLDSAIFIQVDTITPETEMFEFLRDKKFKVKAIRLRGVYSYGLLIPNFLRANIGDDVTKAIGVKKYEPPTPTHMNGNALPQSLVGWIPRYTKIERIENYPNVIEELENVIVTEKIHGTNLRISKLDGSLFIGGHNWMWEEDTKNLYWRVVKETGIYDILMETLPDQMVLFGEVYGKKVQSLQYNIEKPSVLFYDIYNNWQWYNFERFNKTMMELKLSEYIVPIIYKGMYSREYLMTNLRWGKSAIANHIREGVVIKPLFERSTVELPRVIFKAINPEYETKRNRTDFY